MKVYTQLIDRKLIKQTIHSMIPPVMSNQFSRNRQLQKLGMIYKAVIYRKKFMLTNEEIADRMGVKIQKVYEYIRYYENQEKGFK